MGLLARAIIEPFERRAILQNPPDSLRPSLGGSSSASGATASALTALGSPAVLAAVRIFLHSIAPLPPWVHRRTDQGEEPDPEHPLYAALYERPNTEETSSEWRKLPQIHLLLYGNANCAICTIRDMDNNQPGAGEIASTTFLSSRSCPVSDILDYSPKEGI